MNKGGMVVAPKGGYCGDMELEYAPKGTIKEKETLAQKLAVAGELLRQFIKGMTPDMCVHDRCQICLTSFTSYPFHSKNCPITKAQSFLSGQLGDYKEKLHEQP